MCDVKVETRDTTNGILLDSFNDINKLPRTRSNKRKNSQYTINSEVSNPNSNKKTYKNTLKKKSFINRKTKLRRIKDEPENKTKNVTNISLCNELYMDKTKEHINIVSLNTDMKTDEFIEDALKKTSMHTPTEHESQKSSICMSDIISRDVKTVIENILNDLCKSSRINNLLNTGGKITVVDSLDFKSSLLPKSSSFEKNPVFFISSDPEKNASSFSLIDEKSETGKSNINESEMGNELSEIKITKLKILNTVMESKVSHSGGSIQNKQTENNMKEISKSGQLNNSEIFDLTMDISSEVITEIVNVNVTPNLSKRGNCNIDEVPMALVNEKYKLKNKENTELDNKELPKDNCFDHDKIQNFNSISVGTFLKNGQRPEQFFTNDLTATVVNDFKIPSPVTMNELMKPSMKKKNNAPKKWSVPLKSEITAKSLSPAKKKLTISCMTALDLQNEISLLNVNKKENVIAPTEIDEINAQLYSSTSLKNAFSTTSDTMFDLEDWKIIENKNNNVIKNFTKATTNMITYSQNMKISDINSGDNSIIDSLICSSKNKTFEEVKYECDINTKSQFIHFDSECSNEVTNLKKENETCEANEKSNEILAEVQTESNLISHGKPKFNFDSLFENESFKYRNRIINPNQSDVTKIKITKDNDLQNQTELKTDNSFELVTATDYIIAKNNKESVDQNELLGELTPCSDKIAEKVSTEYSSCESSAEKLNSNKDLSVIVNTLNKNLKSTNKDDVKADIETIETNDQITNDNKEKTNFDLSVSAYSKKQEDINKESLRTLKPNQEKEDILGFDEYMDMDDEFELTASQLRMLDADEREQTYPVTNSKSIGLQTEISYVMNTENASIYYEIIDELHHLRVAVDIIKEELNKLKPS